MFFQNLIQTLNDFLWSYGLLILLPGLGLYLMARLSFFPLRFFKSGIKNLLSRNKGEEGDISPFKALMTSLSATVGTGNIAGVATAIAIGGPGALFWMWISALLGMATKFSEAVCAVHFRETDQNDKAIGGPMFYIKKGLSSKWHFLAPLFALFTIFASFGIGNTVQVHSITDILHSELGLSKVLVSTLLMIVTAFIVIGGLKRIATAASRIVPLMIIIYMGSALYIIAMNAHLLGDIFSLIFSKAFTLTAGVGGFAGASVALTIQMGIARGVFSNEAGLGSSPIAHASARTNHPISQGLVAMVGVFIDTIVVCTLTGLVILLSTKWTTDLNGAPLTAESFKTFLPFGSYVVTITLPLFAFTTLLGWNFYGQQTARFLMGEKGVKFYKIIWIAVIPLGALMDLKHVWILGDLLNGLMAVPNIIALFILTPIIIKLSKEYKEQR